LREKIQQHLRFTLGVAQGSIIKQWYCQMRLPTILQYSSTPLMDL